ncbi:N-acetylglucosamine-6-phosphate deacetylase [Anaerococcus sp. AGMB09787]|uniref:N-acetylglucosamine-6-phosphate deacetylase n=1 Tax=Anaerococcus sp. AGMB09787 TaxID=2922869 RepID=UPI001FAFFCB5|nr:N-acetylglucosamine-6-phosphate deacetylase [Anaerococcus sp. AGMB09787]
MSYYVKAKNIVLEDRLLKDSYLKINDDGTFGRVLKEIPKDSRVIDYSNYTIAPGLFDTHIHGYGSYDVMDNDFEGLNLMSEKLLSCGVTSFLPTTLTDSFEKTTSVLENIAKNYKKIEGAKIQGIFLEGPFFSEKFKGAQNEKYMSPPSIDKLAKWDEASNHLVRKIAIAPELEGSVDFIDWAVDHNIYVALGHSDATFEEAKEAVDHGANIFVHTFNAMSNLLHRHPSMVGAAFSLEDVYAELICDGHHNHPYSVNALLRARGIDQTVLITDCMRAGGMGEGESSLGDFAVTIKDGTAKLKGTDTLAGSILELILAVKNIVKWGFVSFDDALRMASLYPAKSVGVDDLCGKIAYGRDADFIVVDDELNLIATYLDGELRYEEGENK